MLHAEFIANSLSDTNSDNLERICIGCMGKYYIDNYTSAVVILAEEKKEEKQKEESEDESDDDMGFGLFD